nr:hypothetical protein [Tanacetum cinerariifolium]
MAGDADVDVLLGDNMADENVLAPALTRSDDQILSFSAWFWNTLTYVEEVEAYSFQLDEDWFTLDENLLRDALEITPINQALQFESPSSGDVIMDFVNWSGYTEEIHFVSRMAVLNPKTWILCLSLHLTQIKKYQAQQNKLATKTKRRNFYMSILRSNAGWKAKDFKGMTFKHIEEKLIPVWEKMQDCMPMNSRLESKRLKRPGIQLDKERFKKLKIAKALGTEPTQEQQSEEPKELSEEELKKMMELVPVEELYIE